jgi:predicted GNAT superfamily acetyltransferase
MIDWTLRLIEEPRDLEAVEALQRLVWPGDDIEVVPVHMLVAAVRGGGLVIGAYTLIEGMGTKLQLVGFVFGFPGFYFTPDGPRLKHCSHMMGVHPDYRDHGLGYALKRAQWQMVRRQSVDRITWTYDPLQSRNGNLNIAKLGAVCNVYHREYYGVMRDGINVGLPSDRFEVDWWVNTRRVDRRLSKHPPRRLDLAHYLAGGVEIINPSEVGENGIPLPSSEIIFKNWFFSESKEPSESLLLVEIPADFNNLKQADPSVAHEWRLHTRAVFEELFKRGYLITDFVFLPGSHPRSFYVLTYGMSTL